MPSNELELYERCPRLLKWSQDHLGMRVSPIKSLYAGLEAGLEGKDPRNAVMGIAAEPGLDIEGMETYGIAVHLSRLAEILSLYLLGTDKAWTRCGESWDAGGDIRRIVLIDRWTEDRKMAEIRSWRTVGEICRHDRPMLLNFIVIGLNVENRRTSAWSRGWTHPKNGGLKFKRKDGGSLGEGWEPVWRERWAGTTDRWLGTMQRDGVFRDLVHSVKVSVPQRRDEYLADMERIERDIKELPENPPMRRSGCYKFSPCTFVDVCHGQTAKTPSECGWVKLSDVKNAPMSAPTYANVG